MAQPIDSSLRVMTDAKPHYSKSEITNWEKQYLHILSERYGWIMAEGPALKQVKLEGVFKVVQAIRILPEELASENFPSNEAISTRYHQPETGETMQSPLPCPLSYYAADHKHLVILGEPGSGKSLFIQALALSFSGNRWAKSTIDRIPLKFPVVIDLRVYDESKFIADFSSEIVAYIGQFDVTSTEKSKEIAKVLINKWIDEGEFAILLDGLDEIAIETRRIVVDRIAAFSNTPAGLKTHVIITSRLEGYGLTIIQNKTFGHCMICPFNSANEVLPFAISWLQKMKDLNEKEATEQSNRICNQFINGSLGNSLLCTPLLIRLALITWDAEAATTLNRTKLYQRYINHVVLHRGRKWGKKPKNLTPSLIEKILGEIAISLHTKKAKSTRDIIDLIEEQHINNNGEDILDYFRECLGLLIGYGVEQDESIGFFHTSFLDFFVANQLAPKILNGSASEYQINDLIRIFIFELISLKDHENPPYDSCPETMVYIPPGPFIMGAGDQISIKRIDYGYFVDISPITNRQYYVFFKETGHATPRHWVNNEPPEESLDHPVVYITWHDAYEYAKWARKKLITEEEWEKAARGIDGRDFPWGENFHSKFCNTQEAGINSTTKISKYPFSKSIYGCMDMSGNVLEWVLSSSQHYEDFKILKGGCFCYPKNLAKCGHRVNYHPSLTHNFFGFRTSLPLESPSDNKKTTNSSSIIAKTEAYIPNNLGGELEVLCNSILSSEAGSIKLTDNMRKILHPIIAEKASTLYQATRKKFSPPGMVYIPPGEFISGGDKDGHEELRVEKIEYPYFIDVNPVSIFQYFEFLKWLKSYDHRFCHPEEPKNKEHDPEMHTKQFNMHPDYFSSKEYNHFPIVNIDWWDAYAYANWARKELPSELEWEKASRGIDGRLYPYGDEFKPTFCNALDGGLGKTNGPGSFPNGISPFGCEDMSGNIWEWCRDKFSPNDQREDTIRVVKGGSFNSDREKARCAYRNGRLPFERFVSRGFRCIKRKK